MNDLEPLPDAIVPLLFRWNLAIPNNTIIAYTLLTLPQVPFMKNILQSENARNAFWQLYNRLYCLGLDYTNRSI